MAAAREEECGGGGAVRVRVAIWELGREMWATGAGRAGWGAGG